MKNLLIIISAALLATSCKKEPVTSFCYECEGMTKVCDVPPGTVFTDANGNPLKCKIW